MTVRKTPLFILNVKCCIMGLLKPTSSTKGAVESTGITHCILWTDNDLSNERAVSWWIWWTLTALF